MRVEYIGGFSFCRIYVLGIYCVEIIFYEFSVEGGSFFFFNVKGYC